MANIFLMSDPHLGHEAMLSFCHYDGIPLRPGFANADEMDEYLIYRNNSVVRPQDHLYCLGDVAMAKKDVPTIAKFNGHKRLVLGNHDIYQTKYYLQFFEKVFGSRRLDDLLLSHYPVHPGSLGGVMANVHGHVHNNVEKGHFGPMYWNVSVEALDDYTPISLEDLKVKIRKQQEEYANQQ